MCGIAAIIEYTKITPKREDVKAMLNKLAHRGPDGEGILIDKSVALGHRRLAILDVDHRSDQPMSYGSHHIIFNGLIYNYEEIKVELKTLNHNFITTSDTEVILHAYKKWGLDAFKKFNGMWSIIIYDTEKNEVICSRDRFGIKPLYYTEYNQQIILASEIKAFTVLKDWRSIINHNRVYDFLLYNRHDHTSETMYEGVLHVPKAHHLILNLNTGEKRFVQYYDIEKPTKTNDGSDFKDLFIDAIKLRTRSDVPLACTLSGGLDSSSIVGSLASELDTPVDTYSLSYPNQKVDESNYAQLVSNKYNLKSHSITTSEDYLLNNLDTLVYQQDEPFVGATVMAQYHIYEQAREDGFKVIIGGQGGDEILAGYYKFLWGLISSGTLISYSTWRQVSAFFDKRSISKYKAIRKFLSFNKKKKVSWYKGINQDRNYDRPRERSVFDMSYNLLFGLGLSALLRYEDRNSMSHGVESRLAFLDHRLVEYCLHMRDDLKVDNGIMKKILREAMQDILPKEVIDRHDKMGFETPQYLWMENNNKDYSKMMDEALAVMPFVDKELLLSDTESDFDLMWRVICVGKWIKIHNISTV